MPSPKHSGKPRVVVFSDHLLYPSETFIRAQANGLSEFEPVFAGSRRVQGLELPEDRTYTINQGKVGGKVREIAFKLMGTAPHLTKQLRELNPILLHAHYGSNGWRALPLAEKLGVPLIVTLHGSDVTATDLRYHQPYYGQRRYLANRKQLQKRAKLFLAVSEFIRRKLLEQGFPEERVLVHYTGVDTKAFRPASVECGPMIVFVGRLVESKGVHFLIKAAAEVQKKLPATELVLIGDGPLRAGLEKQASELLKNYRFLGACGQREVQYWMNRASVFCAPSVRIQCGAEEAFGMVYVEAQAVGKPVVAFDSGGISEAVSHGHTGFLAPERDWQALADYLLTLLQNAELRERFGAAGRERVVRRFDLEKRTKVLEDIYAAVSGITGPDVGREYIEAAAACEA